MSDANLDLAQKLIEMTAAGADAADTIVSDSASLSLSRRMGELKIANAPKAAMSACAP